MSRFRDYFDLEKELIDAPLAWNPKGFGGFNTGWMLNTKSDFNGNVDNRFDLIALNSNEEEYKRFLEKYFYKPLEYILDSKSMSRSIYPTLYLEEDLNGNKKLTFNYVFLITELLSGLKYTDIIEVTEIPESLEEYIDFLKESYIKERKVFFDVKKNNSNSKYYNDFVKEFNMYKENGLIPKYIDFENYIDSKISFCTKWIVACRYLEDFFKRDIIFEELIDIVGHDKLCLICAKSFLDYIKKIEEKDNHINATAYFIECYIDRINAIRNEDKNYDCRIKYFDGKNIRVYGVDDLIKEYKIVRERHPEFHTEKLDATEIIQYFLDNDIDIVTEIDNMTKKELTNLIRDFVEGIRLEDVSDEDYLINIKKLEDKEVIETDPTIKNKIKQQIDKMEFLYGIKPLKIIKGIGSFSDYYGYVFPNGYVVLDAILDDLNKSYGNGIYIMPYNKLIEYSQERKNDIKGKYDVIPIIHKGDWKKRTLDKLNSLEQVPMSLTDGSIEVSDIVDSEKIDFLKEKLGVLEEYKQEIKRKVKEAQIIDEELKNSDIREELTRTEEEELMDEEIDLLNKINEGTSFSTLHSLAKEKKPNLRRNADVSLQTKLRTKDEHGFMHCDFCESRGEDNYTTNRSPRMFETHHIIPISEGGVDNLYNTTCLCPNCHKRIHNYLRLINKNEENQEFDESVIGEFITYAEYGNFLKKVRERIENDTPEYLSYFDRLFDPNYHDDKNLSESELEEMYSQEEKYYEDNKFEEDQKFLREWNVPIRR